MAEFKEFPKIARLYRKVIVTEKIDGTNACVIVGENGGVAAQSRSRLITPADDNYGFARWVTEHAKELEALGPGHHFGEWWGQGIQRKYGQTIKRFSLFRVDLWGQSRPDCCDVVPVLQEGIPEQGLDIVRECVERLRRDGSMAAPGFMKPEGIVAFHSASGMLLKALLENDAEHKGK